MHRSRSLLLSAGKAAKDGLFGNPEAAYPYKLLYHHKDPSLFPYRIPGTLSYALHNASSSISAVFSLCTSQASRDLFLELTGSSNLPGYGDGDDDDSDEDGNDSVIQTKIVGQSDMGFLKVMTLYEDLQNPLYERNPRFDVREFMGGCGWALQQFHRTKDELLPKLFDKVEMADGEEGDVQSKFLRNNYDLLAAAKNPDSLEHDLVAMTTPLVLEQVKMESAMKLMMMGAMLGRGKDVFGTKGGAPPEGGTTVKEAKRYAEREKVAPPQISNVALLSANVAEIYPSVKDYADETFAKKLGIYPPALDVGEETPQKKGEEDPDAPLEDDSLEDDSFLKKVFKRFDELGPQTVAQLEVLYELQRSVIDEDEKTRSETTVLVATFETCIENDPTGDDELRWRIANYRPAVEFGFFQ